MKQLFDNDSRYLIIGRAVQTILMIANYKIITSLLGTSDIGYYYFVIAVFSFAGFILINPIGMYGLRHVLEWQKLGSLYTNIKNILKIYAFGSLLVYVYILVFREKFSYEQNDVFFIAPVICLYFITSSIVLIILPMLNILGYQKRFMILTNLNAVMIILIPLIFYYFTQNVVFWIFGMSVGQLITSMFLILFLKKELNLDSQGMSVQFINKETLNFILPIVFTNIGLWLIGHSYRYLYKGNIDLEILAKISLGVGLSSAIMGLVESLCNQLYLPEFYNEIIEGDIGPAWSRYNSIASKIFFMTMLYTICLSPFMLRIVLSVKYQSLFSIVILASVIELFRVLGNVCTIYMHGEKSTKLLVLPCAISGSIAFVLYYFVSIGVVGENKTIFILMLSYFIFFALQVGAIKKKYHFDWYVNELKDLIKKPIWISFIFAVFFWPMRESLVFSILICLVFGIIYLYLTREVHASYKKTISYHKNNNCLLKS